MQQYEDYEKMIKSIAWKFAYTTDHFKDLVCEGNLEYVKALISYDSTEDAAFSTYLWKCLFNRMNVLRKKKKMDYLEEIDKQFSCKEPDIVRFIILKDMISSLSANAKEIIHLVLETPDDLYDVIKDEAKLNRRILTDYLVSRGWKFQNIWDSFKEIKMALNNF